MVASCGDCSAGALAADHVRPPRPQLTKDDGQGASGWHGSASSLNWPAKPNGDDGYHRNQLLHRTRIRRIPVYRDHPVVVRWDWRGLGLTVAHRHRSVSMETERAWRPVDAVRLAEGDVETTENDGQHRPPPSGYPTLKASVRSEAESEHRDDDRRDHEAANRHVQADRRPDGPRGDDAAEARAFPGARDAAEADGTVNRAAVVRPVVAS